MLVLLALCALECTGSAGFQQSGRQSLLDAGGNHPEQVWINYGRHPDEMVVSWVTPWESASVVEYGTDSMKLYQLASGESTQYDFRTTRSPYLHHAKLTGLECKRTYYYRVGSPSSGWSEVFHFTAHPGVGPDVTHTFGIVADMSATSASIRTAEDIASDPAVESVLDGGDLGYVEFAGNSWDEWRRAMQPLAAYKPFMFAVGDHDMDGWGVGGAREFHGIARRFRLPWGDPPAHLFYSYEVGPAHIVVLDYAEHRAGSEQLAFLQRDLEAVDRDHTPWVLVITHRPLYAAKRKTVTPGKMQDAIEPELYGKVDFVFAGHLHGYQRFHRIYQGLRDPQGPVHITVGTGGACVAHVSKLLLLLLLLLRKAVRGVRLVSCFDRPLTKMGGVESDMVAFAASQFGYGTLQLDKTSARWTWRGRANRQLPAQEDDVVLHK